MSLLPHTPEYNSTLSSEIHATQLKAHSASFTKSEYTEVSFKTYPSFFPQCFRLFQVLSRTANNLQTTHLDSKQHQTNNDVKTNPTYMQGLRLNVHYFCSLITFLYV
eukprot:TRINITY_DN97573_c0_g1_i2.p1 TRINITY_DN97573_c0_g1~~TRINITY_DN97573_c0_g1_i2.p1  ORF type:complete len:107 (-),score=9.62 TRINITY_DN97573_c0_g1_i2:60-380(-)